jgi:hypothetical protein
MCRTKGSNNNYTCSLENAAVKAVLEQLHNASKKDHTKFAFRMLPYF